MKCAVCNRPLAECNLRNPRAVYCSPACQQAAYRERRTAAEAERQRAADRERASTRRAVEARLRRWG